ncbi:threonyl-tRNA synthetase [Thermoproteus uzoniensis 768-20]|uniref:Threonine--tRNA ligase n=1 Tax=Thermoproteus uzoniensis (strain 768-20) TaxID=999630 RepID=F2L4V3_THEU7|nr:threonine--tRNA ligase [Thermoproteus uzoniensis]AEA13457.1 threonyl-tRNA synthetase [Thermoproteus uzoniensis 768-20]
MRVLLIHAESFRWEPKEPAGEIRDEPNSGEAKNALVAFITVEEGDVLDDGYLSRVAEDIVDVARRVKASSIVIYPYAHLSSKLARPYLSKEILSKVYNIVSATAQGFSVLKAPFGYYKEFELKCLGHPLSELSRSYTPEATPRPSTQQAKQQDVYLILTPDGDEYDPVQFPLDKYPDLKALVEKEVFRKELPGGEPKYIEYVKRFTFDWEPMSDIGHMRYGPDATIMMELVEDYAFQVARSLGIPIFKIRGTNMFKLSEKPIETHAKLFGERLYIVETDVDSILRYAACFQQFAMAKDWVISYRNLPFGMLEIADSYRYEQPGETVLLFRLRRFYMPDLHIFTKNLNEAIEVTYKLHEKIFEEIRKINRDYVSLYNITAEFYKGHKDYLVELAKREGKPILLRILPEQKYYWVLNVEFHIIDELGRPREIATFQIDVGNAMRFGIKYIDEENKVKYPVIIHTAILGSVERYIFALFDTAALMEKRGEVPRLPTWITPVQVRIIPVNREYLRPASDLADELERRGIRVDIDDREETLSRKIRDAEREWIPYIIVIGQKEASSNMLTVRIRGKGQVQMSRQDLVEVVEKEISGFPRRPLYMPRLLSQRPSYKQL